MVISYRCLLLIFLEFIQINHAVICNIEDFQIRCLRETCTDQIAFIKDNCPLELQKNYNCRAKKLKNVSEIERNVSYCSLDISYDKFEILDAGTFLQWTNLVALDLSNNHYLEVIDPDAFKGLQNLRYLNLKESLAFKTFNSYQVPEVFRHLPELIILDITKNNIESYELIEKTVRHTRKLKYLALEGCPSCTFGPEFATLKQLIALDQTVEEEWCYCFIEILSDNYFQNLQFLKFLYLSDCRIKTISPQAFVPLSQIELLDLSYNYNLTFDRAMIGLQGLRNATSLRTLKLNFIHPLLQGHSVTIKKEHITFLSNLNVEELHLEGNKLDVFEYGVLSALPDTIKTVNLRHNRLAIDNYLDEFFDSNRTLKHLKVLDISYQNSAIGSYSPNKLSEKKKKLKRRDTMFTFLVKFFKTFVAEVALPPRLENITCLNMGWNFLVPEINVSPSNSIKNLDLSVNGLYTWIGPVNGLNQLENLSLANNFCNNISDVFFSTFKGLKRLSIQGNLLGIVLEWDSDGIIFSSLKSLQYLDISSNQISKLPPRIFQHMVSLEELIISYNMLSKFEIDVLTMTNLTNIDMSYNKIETLPNSLTHHMDRIAKNNHVVINLSGNPISCTCENIEFLRWMMETNVQLKYDSVCSHQTKMDTAEKLRSLEKECTSKVGLIAGCIAFIVLAFAVIFGGIIYRYKWHLRYLYYSARNSVGIRHHGEDYTELYQYDSFISYAEEDKPFVYNGILPEIEEKFGLRLCIADRDFTPGVSVPENIIRAISSSRRAIFVLSHSFLDSYWCKYELNMARIEAEKKNRKFVIVVMYEYVSNDELPLDIMEVIRSQTYIDYPDDEMAREAFWRRLKETID
ncbi:hypothetical protein ACJMK2_016116 [Sinanodonta woodiana]|uniref:TIR domain-containing protein n=1 Tax=Sinanodonta woodiana TaxID=1069815 RepID=A0ABD3USV0_SINWO